MLGCTCKVYASVWQQSHQGYCPCPELLHFIAELSIHALGQPLGGSAAGADPAVCSLQAVLHAACLHTLLTQPPFPSGMRHNQTGSSLPLTELCCSPSLLIQLYGYMKRLGGLQVHHHAEVCVTCALQAVPAAHLQRLSRP